MDLEDCPGVVGLNTVLDNEVDRYFAILAFKCVGDPPPHLCGGARISVIDQGDTTEWVGAAVDLVSTDGVNVVRP